MSENEIEIGESIEVVDVLDDDGDLLGTVVDDVVVITGEGGSIVDETVDVFDADGNLVAEEEVVDVYDAECNLIAEVDTTVIIDG